MLFKKISTNKGLKVTKILRITNICRWVIFWYIPIEWMNVVLILHKIWSFPWRISSVNVTKSEIQQWKFKTIFHIVLRGISAKRKGKNRFNRVNKVILKQIKKSQQLRNQLYVNYFLYSLFFLSLLLLLISSLLINWLVSIWWQLWRLMS